jgi:hypothetical protein
MNSKFSIKAFLPILCFVSLISLLGFYILNAFFQSNTPIRRGTIPIPIFSLLSFTVLWLFFGEIRTKMIKVKLEESYLTIRRFGGIGPPDKIFYSSIDGFKISILHSRGGSNEYLYLMKGNRKIGKISDFYHKNYDTLKKKIATLIIDLGYEEFNYWDELKESFS